MSGPLASWVSDHAHVDPALLRDEDGRLIASEKAVVDVVIQLALTSYPDGISAYAPSWDELAHRTRTSRSTVGAALKVAERAKLISVDRPGRGRGKVTVYRVHATLCDPAEGCWACSAVAIARTEKVRPPDVIEIPGHARKGPAHRGKGPAHRGKGPAAGPTTENGGTAPPLGGAVPHRESDDRAPLRYAPRGSAAPSAVDGHPDPPGPSPTRPGPPATEAGREGDPRLCEHEEGVPCSNHCRHRNCARDCGTCHDTRREVTA